MNIFKRLIDSSKPDPERDVGKLLNDNENNRWFAAYLLKDAMDHGELDVRFAPRIASALGREGERLLTIKLLLEILFHFRKDREVRAYVDKFLAKASLRILDEENVQLLKKSTVLFLEECIDYIPREVVGCRLLQLALTRMVLDTEVRSWYQFRCFRVLRRIDESFLDKLSDEDRQFFTEWEKGFERNCRLTKGAARLTAHLVIRQVFLSLSDALIESAVPEQWELFTKRLRDQAIAPSGTALRFETVSLADGKTLTVPDLASLPNTELFSTLENIVRKFAGSMSAT